MDQLPLDSLLVLVSFTMDVPLLLALHPPVSSSYSILLRQAAMNIFFVFLLPSPLPLSLSPAVYAYVLSFGVVWSPERHQQQSSN